MGKSFKVLAFLTLLFVPLRAQVTDVSLVTFSTLPDTLVIANPVRVIFPDHTGKVWFGTSMGLYYQNSDTTAARYVYDDTSFAQVSRNNILSGAATPDSNIYVGSPVGLTIHSGLSVSNDSLVSYLALPDSMVNLVKADSSEAWQIWGAGGGYVWVRADTVEVTFSPDSGLLGPTVYDIAIDSTGSIWFATSGGVSRLIGGYWIDYTITNSYIPGTINYALAVAGNDSSIWFGGDDGLVSFDGDTTWTNWTDSVSNRRVRALAYSPDDTTMWAATDSGLYGYRPDRPYPISTWRKYFPGNTNDSLPQFNLFSVAVDSGGRVWIGHSTGVTRLKEN